MVNASTVATVTGVTVLTGFLTYAVYFDYKRRHDPAFRSRLRKDAKRSQKESKRLAQQQEKEAELFCQKVVQDLNRSGSIIMPDEETFSSQVQLGEALAAQGPEYYLPAAAAFYKAVKFYPAPAELLMIYQKAVPEPCLKFVEKMVSLDPSLKSSADRQQQMLSSYMNEAAAAARGGAGASRLEEIDDEEPKAAVPKTTNGASSVSGSNNSGTNTHEDGAPSVSSQEWEKVSHSATEENDQKVEQPAVASTAVEGTPVSQSESDSAPKVVSFAEAASASEVAPQ